jgi:hypothetical protein
MEGIDRGYLFFTLFNQHFCAVICCVRYMFTWTVTELYDLLSHRNIQVMTQPLAKRCPSLEEVDKMTVLGPI